METYMWREILIPYEQAVNELVIKFESIVNESRRLGTYSPIEFVTGRVKKISSILDKANKKNIQMDAIEEELEDIAGIRIICQFVEDIDRVVQLIHARKDMDIKYEKDYVQHTKKSGYRSYHIIVYYDVHTALGEKRVQAEIQIRTLAMDFWATIEHSLQYKYGQNIPISIKNRLIRSSEVAHMLDQEMSKIRDEIMEAQSSFQYKSNIVADILNNLQNIKKKSENPCETDKLQETFTQLWEEGDLEKLIAFNKHLDNIAEIYRVQSV